MTVPGNLSSPLLATAAEAAAAAVGPTKSLRFNPGDSAYLNKTFSSGNRRTFTYSYWIKESGKGTSPSNNPHVLWSGADASTRGGLVHRGTGSDASKLYIFNQESNSTNCQVFSNSLHRDFSAWKHIVWSIDTTQSTSTNRVKLYINGVQETLYFATTPAQNLQLQININQEHRIGRGTPDDYGNFYLADVHFIDGSALDATSFGAYDDSGVWQVATYSGTFGTNGFHLLDFANEATIGHDSSGNENDFTANNISTTAGAGNDVLFDVPTNGTQSDTGAGGEVSGNYATLNPLNKSTGTLSNGNLDYSISAVGSCRGSMMVSSGKWYFEVKLTASGNPYVGIAGVGQAVSGGAGYIAPNAIAANNGGSIYYRYGGSTTYPGKTVSIGTGTIGIAIDVDNKKIWWSKNGTWYKFSSSANQTTTISEVEAGNFSTSFSNLEGDFFTVHLGNSTSNNTIYEFNAGQRAFAYSAPSGYKALCTTNLPTATIADGSAQFDTVLYTGNGATGSRSITGLSFAPDWSWFKGRSYSISHLLYDAVRGAGSTKSLVSNGTNTEGSAGDNATFGYLESFDSSGFSIFGGSDVNNGYINKNSATYASWHWNAGANSNKTYTVKVVSDSGNKYRFDDFGTSAVTLDLAEGSTYIFDQSDSSNAGHPIRFGTSANGTDYTTGVTHTGTPGSAGAKTTLVLGTGVATLYYSCANHSGMGGQINTNSTAGSSNFDGTIQTTVKANPEAGFSIAIYPGSGSSGDTLGHGLNAEPEFAIVKARTKTDDWRVYHKAIGTGHYLQVNNTNAKTTTGNWQSVSSTTLGLNSDSAVNSSSYTYLALFFAPVAGYSAFGSYTGNGSDDGPFVYLGFRPKFLILKNTNQAFNWRINDTSRAPGNVVSETLFPNTNSAEASSSNNLVDILSNGFKLRKSGSPSNHNGNTFIYAAFAENPFQANGGLAR